MSDLLIDNQAVPSTPASGKIIIFSETGGKRVTSKDDSGKTSTLAGAIRNYSTADLVATSVDTYLTGSNLAIPTGLTLQVGTTFRWRFYMTKTGAGTVM